MAKLPHSDCASREILAPHTPETVKRSAKVSNRPQDVARTSKRIIGIQPEENRNGGI